MINKFGGLDWLCFGFCVPDGKWQDGALAEIEKIFENAGVTLMPGTGCRFYRFMLKGPGVVVKYGKRISNNRDIEIELSGEFFCLASRSGLALEMVRTFGGVPNRIDYAWDFLPECLGELNQLEDLLQSIESKRGARREDKIVNREWTGTTFGYGKGSEICLRVYNKLLEQREKGVKQVQNDGSIGWWRVELTVRGNTLKDQGFLSSDWDMAMVEDFCRAVCDDRYQIPSELRIAASGFVAPRRNGSCGLMGKVAYWNAVAGKAQQKLIEFAKENGNHEISGKRNLRGA